MEQIFGNYIEEDDGQEYLVIHFSPASTTLQNRWRNNGLSADFLAEYWATFFPTQDDAAQDRRAEVKGIINYVANELLENIMKFSYPPANYPVHLGLHLYEKTFRFYAHNATDPETVPEFQTRIQRLLTEDPGDLYMEQIETNARDPENTHSRLGLLTMVSDYNANLAWKFTHQADHPERIIITTMVEITL